MGLAGGVHSRDLPQLKNLTLLTFTAFCLFISQLAQYQNQIHTPIRREIKEGAQEG